MTITLRHLTKENWRSVYQLTKTLTVEQQNFVAPNAYSMLEALYDPELYNARAIHADETLVGFLMTGYDSENREHWIDRLMIAGEYQGKGYGRAAMQIAIDEFKAMPDCESVFISFELHNRVAQTLYVSLGFLDTGRIEDGEMIYRLPLREASVSKSDG